MESIALNVGDIVTVTPLGERTFEVVALDDLYGETVFAHPTDGEEPAQWYSLTHVKKVVPTPAEPPMTREALTAWLVARGAEPDLAYWVERYQGCTESEMDVIYEEMHC